MAGKQTPLPTGRSGDTLEMGVSAVEETTLSLLFLKAAIIFTMYHVFSPQC